MFYDIFISYHKDQINEVQRFCTRFRQSGIRLWCHQISNNSLINVFDDSLTALTHSFLFVCFMSKSYKNSLKCKAELMTAQEQKIQIVLFLFDDLSEKDSIFNYPYLEVYNAKEDLDFSINTIDPKYISILDKFNNSFDF
ncbi:hypothetical protein BpHYR1_026942 [Brachionus plicatilis]|uniref:TIR domain-containing protein n=1 Tax=Brachionus plicatilis TaxID=10195 RepID=A0A3M7P9J1_BRAPC|nr:hypothetical protein BpHYR1_026942 [Brachionus plicatilis]